MRKALFVTLVNMVQNTVYLYSLVDMPKCTITRTHRQGIALRDRDFDPPIAGPVQSASYMHPVLRRMVQYLYVPRMAHGGLEMPEPIPKLYEPKIVTFGSEVATMISGFEELGGQRLYQGWYIKWED